MQECDDLMVSIEANPQVFPVMEDVSCERTDNDLDTLENTSRTGDTVAYDKLKLDMSRPISPNFA